MENEKVNKLLGKMSIAYGKYAYCRNKLQKEVQEICDFKIDVTHLEGDGFNILEVDTTDVFSFNALDGKSKKNKLTRDEVFNFSF